MKNLAILTGAAAMALNALSANAVYINGSISFSDGFDTLPTPPPPTTSIVSSLTFFDVSNPILVNSPGGDFAGTTVATAYDFDINSLPQNFFDTATGFSFLLSDVSVSSTPLSCNANGLCRDDITLDVAGIVSGAGFDDTEFLGTWTGNGSCQGGAGQCTTAPTASWSVSLTATGREAPPLPVPEPTVISLIGLGLAGIGLGTRRRRAVKRS
jgi:hypothetical protein